MRRPFVLSSNDIRRRAKQAIDEAPEGYHVMIRPSTRTLEQNALLWSCLNDLSRQVEWPINGVNQKLSPDDWKDIVTASLSEENRIAQGIQGGFVVLGKSTSKMSVKQMTDLIEFIHAFGDEQGVKWSPTSLGR